MDHPTTNTVSSQRTTIYDLPVSVLLSIFSHVDEGTLLSGVARVCRFWRDISSDELLWRQKLKEYSNRLITITRETYPPAYTRPQTRENGDTDCLTNKEIYLRCARSANRETSFRRAFTQSAVTSSPSPPVTGAVGQRWSVIEYVSRYVSSLMGRIRLGRSGPPYCCASGPGLNAWAKELMPLMDSQSDATFRNLGYFSSPQVMGIGSGMTLKVTTHHVSDLRVNLSILYTATKRERTAAEVVDAAEAAGEVGPSALVRGLRKDKPNGSTSRAQRRMEANLLFQRTNDSFDLRDNVKRLLGMLNAFVFIVSAEISMLSSGEANAVENLQYVCHELQCFTRALSDDRPVVVLSTRSQRSTGHLSAAQIVRCLQLETLDRPWLLSECVLSEITRDLPPSLQWLTEKSVY